MNNLYNLDKSQYTSSVSNTDIFDLLLETSNKVDKVLGEKDQALEIQQQMANLILKMNNNNVTESKKTFNESKNDVNATVKMLLNKLDAKLGDIEEEFDDIHARIYNFGIVLRTLSELIDNLDEFNINEKYIMRSCVIIHDVIKKVKSENINNEQLNVIKEGIKIIVGGKTTKEQFTTLDNMLLDCGLDWIYGG